MSSAAAEKTSSSAASWPRWRQHLAQIPPNELCGSQKDLIRCMELLDTVSAYIEKRKPYPEPSVATPNAPFTVFLPCLEVLHMPIKDRPVFPLLPHEITKEMIQFLIKYSICMESLATGVGLDDFSMRSPTNPNEEIDVKSLKVRDSPLAIAIYKLSGVAASDICRFIAHDLVQPSGYAYYLKEIEAVNRLLTDEKNKAENEKEMKWLQKTYGTHLTMADLTEMGGMMYTELLLRIADYEPEPHLVDKAVAGFQKFLSAIEKRSENLNNTNIWYECSQMYHMMGPTPRISSLSDVFNDSQRIIKVMQRNLKVAQSCTPWDPLREAWVCLDLALITASPSGWRYTEVEALWKRGAECLAACKPWLPRFYQKSFLEAAEMMEKMLLGARNLFPNDYMTRKLGMEVMMGLDPSVFEESFDLSDTATPRRRCSGCDREGRKMSVCSGCKKVYYCNATCQKRHWKAHKPVCKVI